MTRIILLVTLLMTLAWAFWRLVDGVIEAFGGTTPPTKRRRGPHVAPVRLVRDPVCGTWISRKDQWSLRVGDVTHYFCSDSCRAKFNVNEHAR